LTMSIPDDRLVELFQKGDQGAFSELVRRHEERLFQVCLRIVRDPEDAREALQEVWIKAMTRLETFEGRSNVGTWLHTVATHTSTDLYRKRRRRPEPMSSDVLDGMLPPLASPADQVVDREHLRQLLAKLPPGRAHAFVLRDVLGFSYREIAGFQDLPLTTVQSRILRARRALGELIDLPAPVGLSAV